MAAMKALAAVIATLQIVIATSKSCTGQPCADVGGVDQCRGASPMICGGDSGHCNKDSTWTCQCTKSCKKGGGGAGGGAAPAPAAGGGGGGAAPAPASGGGGGGAAPAPASASGGTAAGAGAAAGGDSAGGAAGAGGDAGAAGGDSAGACKVGKDGAKPAPKKYQLKAEVGACKGGKDGFKAEEAKTMLDLINKMRCAVGVEPYKWSAELACQAQKAQDAIGVLEHGKGDSGDGRASWKLKIQCGEALCGMEDLKASDLGDVFGEPIAHAAWAWFFEYVQGGCNAKMGAAGAGKCGHFNDIVWKNAKMVGCGIQRTKPMVIRCQFAGDKNGDNGRPRPDGDGDAGPDKNVADFKGKEDDYTRCGLDFANAKKAMCVYKKWGVTHPTGAWGESLLKKYDNDVPTVPRVASFSQSGVLVIGTAVLSIVATAAMVGFRRFRDRGTSTYKAARSPYAGVEEEDGDEELLHDSMQ